MNSEEHACSNNYKLPNITDSASWTLITQTEEVCCISKRKRGPISWPHNQANDPPRSCILCKRSVETYYIIHITQVSVFYE
jgi:hypothetical protein